MTERYVIEEIGNMFRVLKDNEPLTTKFENCDKQDVTNLIVELNELNAENVAFKNSDNIAELETEIMKLKEENNELRSDRDYWKTLAQSLARTNGNVELKDEHIGWKRVDVE